MLIKQDKYNGLEKMMKPVFKDLQALFFDYVSEEFPHLPTILHQLQEHKEKAEGLARLRGSVSSTASPAKVKDSQQSLGHGAGSGGCTAPHGDVLKLSLYPVDSRLVTDNHKKLLEEN